MELAFLREFLGNVAKIWRNSDDLHSNSMFVLVVWTPICRISLFILRQNDLLLAQDFFLCSSIRTNQIRVAARRFTLLNLNLNLNLNQ